MPDPSQPPAGTPLTSARDLDLLGGEGVLLAAGGLIGGVLGGGRVA